VGDNGDTEDLDKLSELLANPAKRKEFFVDPETALQAEGIDPDAIPKAFLDALKDLDYGELRLLSGINRKLVDAGLTGSDILNWPV
jgi:indole-3-glycerol phosphate synthase